jgi:hypothetical protein
MSTLVPLQRSTNGKIVPLRAQLLCSTNVSQFKIRTTRPGEKVDVNRDATTA